jgi:hypothetical protein
MSEFVDPRRRRAAQLAPAVGTKVALLAGFRYTYLPTAWFTGPTTRKSARASTRLVDQFAQQLTTPNSNLQALIQQNILSQLGALAGHNPPLPVGRSGNRFARAL